MDIKLGSWDVKPVQEMTPRLNVLIWGASGCGKTTLASTAPGKKLWLLFDPDGDASLKQVKNKEECMIVNLANQGCNVVAQFAAENCANLEKFITENDIETVVFDSVTTYLDLCLQLAVTSVNKATLMQPTLQGYGNRKFYNEKTLKNLIKITGKLNKHLIVLAHEDRPSLNDDGAVVGIEPLLGGQSSATMPIVFSEVWNMHDDGKCRKIRLRQNPIRKPMKTRMFDDTVEFVWNYTPENGGTGIKEWFDEWVKQGTKIKPF